MHVFQFFQNTRVLWIFVCLSATIIPWKGFGLPSSWSQEGGLVILPERNPWIISQNIRGGRTHKESSSPGNGPWGDQSCALAVTGTNLWPAEPSSGQELGFEPRVLLFHSSTHGPKAALEAQGLGTAAPHSALPPGCILNIKKKFICCTPGHREILPCQALHPYAGFHWKRPRCAGKESSPNIPDREQVPGEGKWAWLGSMWSSPEVSRTPLRHKIQMEKTLCRARVDSEYFLTWLFLCNSHSETSPDRFGIDLLNCNASKVNKKQQKIALPVPGILKKLGWEPCFVLRVKKIFFSIIVFAEESHWFKNQISSIAYEYDFNWGQRELYTDSKSGPL